MILHVVVMRMCDDRGLPQAGSCSPRHAGLHNVAADAGEGLSRSRREITDLNIDRTALRGEVAILFTTESLLRELENIKVASCKDRRVWSKSIGKFVAVVVNLDMLRASPPNVC
jgi:hypothetical protein